MAQTAPTFESLNDDPIADRSGSGCSRCGKGTPLAQESERDGDFQPSTAVRYGYMRYIGEFTHAASIRFTQGSRLVIQTSRGLEIGEHVMNTCNGCSRSVSLEQKQKWVEVCGDSSFEMNAGRILREATSADLAEYARIQSFIPEKVRFCQKVADGLGLPIKVVECECPFGGERIIFYFTAENRVDFRDMVKELAREFRTRIELRQVGARDEARLLADFETCGQEVCCKVLLKTLRPISMKMAKLQKATLDPSKVSGRCGRLKCCLSYEHSGYEELDAALPRVGAKILTPYGEASVVGRQIITQLVQVRAEDGKIYSVPIEEVGVGPAPAEPVRPDKDDTTANGQNGSDAGSKKRRRRGGRKRRPAPGGAEGRQGVGNKPTTGSRPAAPKVDDAKRGERSVEKSDGPSEPRSERRRPRRRRRRSNGPTKSGGEGTSGASGSPKE